MCEKIAVITLTRDRPKCFERCSYYLNRQTIKHDYWIIADSGKNKLVLSNTSDQIIIQKEPHSNKAKDFTGNLLNALSKVPNDAEYIIIMEDDDWYHPDYIARTIRRLQNYDLVGVTNAIYYNVRLRSYRKNENTDRASFCETAFRSKLIPIVKFCCEVKRESAFVDSRLWNTKKFTKEYAKALFSESISERSVVGIKGLPGFTGIGIGHKAPGYRKDINFDYLTRLIGKEDTEWYKCLKF